MLARNPLDSTIAINLRAASPMVRQDRRIPIGRAWLCVHLSAMVSGTIGSRPAPFSLNREGNGEGRSFSFLAFHANAPRVLRHDLIGNAET